MSDLSYPVGRFQHDGEITAAHRAAWIGELVEAPSRLRAAVAGLSEEQLDTAYRPGGWTLRQVVHHLADSHIASYVRFRLTLSEEGPVVTARPYSVDGWSGLADATAAPVPISLDLFDALHQRWTTLMQTMTPAQWARQTVYPGGQPRALEQMLGIYAWHCRHHTAHITGLRQRMGW